MFESALKRGKYLSSFFMHHPLVIHNQIDELFILDRKRKMEKIETIC